MSTTRDSRGGHRPRRPPIAVEVRPMLAPMTTDELRQRELELERLIVLAACRRAARRAAPVDDAATPAGG